MDVLPHVSQPRQQPSKRISPCTKPSTNPTTFSNRIHAREGNKCSSKEPNIAPIKEYTRRTWRLQNRRNRIPKLGTKYALLLHNKNRITPTRNRIHGSIYTLHTSGIEYGWRNQIHLQ